MRKVVTRIIEQACITAIDLSIKPFFFTVVCYWKVDLVEKGDGFE